MSYLGQQLGQGQAERFVFTASGGETSVTTSDDGRAVAYTVGQVDVYLNGAKLINGSDFTATTGTSITGLAALTASDVVEVFALSIFQASDTVSAASGGTFNGNVTVDANLSVTGTVDLNGGNIDGTVIGAASTAAGSFTTVAADSATLESAAPYLVLSETDQTDLNAYIGNSAGKVSIRTISDDLGTLTKRFEVDHATGDISFYEDTGTTPKFFWDASTERLGLGTTSPAEVLHIYHPTENVNAIIESGDANAYLSFKDSTTSAANGVYIGVTDGDNFGVYTGGNTARMYINSTGDVGIGTSSPAGITAGITTLAISDEGAKTTGDKTGALAFITNDASFTSTYADGVTAEISSVSETGVGGAYGLAFATATTGASGRAERMRIDASGDVGIGTSSPKTIINASTSTGAILTLESSDTSLTTNDVIGGIDFYANDGSTNGTGAKVNIRGIATSTAGTITALTFGTSDSSSATATERMRIDGSGTLLVGTTDSDLGYTDGDSGVVINGDGPIQAARDSANAIVYLNKLNNDGAIIQMHKDGAQVGSISTIGSAVYLGTGNTQLLFRDASNDIRPVVSGGTNRDDVTDLGASSARFDNIYATNGTIQTSDANEKQDITELDEAERRVAVACKGLLRKFRWKSAIEEKGDDARIHFGIIAQDLQAAFEAEGLDAGRYAMFIHSTWTDEETGEERSRMGVRYSELLAFIIAAL